MQWIMCSWDPAAEKCHHNCRSDDRKAESNGFWLRKTQIIVLTLFLTHIIVWSRRDAMRQRPKNRSTVSHTNETSTSTHMYTVCSPPFSGTRYRGSYASVCTSYSHLQMPNFYSGLWSAVSFIQSRNRLSEIRTYDGLEYVFLESVLSLSVSAL